MGSVKNKRDNEATTPETPQETPAEVTEQETEQAETTEATTEATAETTTPESTVITTGDGEQARQIRSLLGKTNAPAGSLVEQVRWLIAENARLASLADQGRQYRTDLIEEAISEGIRALGPGFQVETYRAMFGNASIETIKKLRDGWTKQAGGRFPGKRQTVDEPQRQSTNGTPDVPRAAYKS